MRLIVIVLFSSVICLHASPYAQGADLDTLLGNEMEDQTTYAIATFKSSRIVTGHSVEQMPDNGLEVRFSHRFGTVDSADNLFGLDDMASTAFSFEYGLTDELLIGLGRSSLEKTYHAFLKGKLLRQCSGNRNIPFTISFIPSVAIKSKELPYPDHDIEFSSRVSYTLQFLVARKFNNAFSLQLSPTLIHRNLVDTESEHNSMMALGLGGRYKLSNRLSLNFEYFYVHDLDDEIQEYNHPLSLGLDIQMGGHVFQIILTNSAGITENDYLLETRGDWSEGDLRLGFNLSQVF